ncbi:unnamed protein product [Arctogadus glacialis]
MMELSPARCDVTDEVSTRVTGSSLMSLLLHLSSLLHLSPPPPFPSSNSPLQSSPLSYTSPTTPYPHHA